MAQHQENHARHPQLDQTRIRTTRQNSLGQTRQPQAGRGYQGVEEHLAGSVQPQSRRGQSVQERQAVPRALDLLPQPAAQEGALAALRRREAAQVHQRQQGTQEVVIAGQELRRPDRKRTQEQVHSADRQTKENPQEPQQIVTNTHQRVPGALLCGPVHCRC